MITSIDDDMFKVHMSSMSYPVSVCVLIHDVIITWFVTPLTWLFPPKALSALLSTSRSLARRELKKYRSMRFFRTLSRYKATRICKEIKVVVPLKRGTGGGRLSCWRGRNVPLQILIESLPDETYIIPFRIWLWTLTSAKSDVFRLEIKTSTTILKLTRYDTIR